MVHSKVVQSAGNFHNEVSILFLSISEDIFDDTTSFHPSHDRFNTNANPGNKAMLLALFWRQFSASGLFLRLKRRHIRWFIALKTGLFLVRLSSPETQNCRLCTFNGGSRLCCFQC